MSKTPVLYIRRRKEDGSLGDLEPAFGEGESLEMLLIDSLAQNEVLKAQVVQTNEDLMSLMELILTRGLK